MATNPYQLPGMGASSAAAPTGIAPAPNAKMPMNSGGFATPGGGGTGAPLQPTGAPVAPLPNFNPASRDAAIRNLGTQTPAAPTVAPATAPAPAAATPGASGAPAAGASGPIPVDIPPGQQHTPTPMPPTPAPAGNGPSLYGLMQSHPDIANFVQQYRAADPTQQQQLRQQFHDQIEQWLQNAGKGGPQQDGGGFDSFRDAREQARDERRDDHGFSDHWDRFDQEDADNQQANNQPSDNNGQPTDAELNAQAASNRRVRMSRQSGGAGIYTGKAG